MNDDMRRLCEAAKMASISPMPMADNCAQSVVRAILTELKAAVGRRSDHEGTIHDAQIARYTQIGVDQILRGA